MEYFSPSELNSSYHAFIEAFTMVRFSLMSISCTNLFTDAIKINFFNKISHLNPFPFVSTW